MIRKEGHKQLVQFRFKLCCCFKTSSSRHYLSFCRTIFIQDGSEAGSSAMHTFKYIFVFVTACNFQVFLLCECQVKCTLKICMLGVNVCII